jgi:hypothetical protein
MASIMLKDIPEEMHAHLKKEAEANFRSLTQEALMRIELSFRMEEAFNTKRDERWIQEALESGPEEPLSRTKFDAAFRKARKRVDQSKKAAL